MSDWKPSDPVWPPADETVKGHWTFRFKVNTGDPDEIARNLRLVADHVSTRRASVEQHSFIILHTLLGRKIGIASFEME